MSQWEQEEGEHWAANADRYSRVLSGFGEALLAAARPAPGQRVLDVGCGCGDTAVAAAAAVGPQGYVLGIDVSPAMIAIATDRAAERGARNLELLVADVAGHRSEAPDFDVALSRFGVMYFADPVAAFRSIRSMLRGGGRLVFTCWRDLRANEWMTVPGLAVASVASLQRAEASEEPSPFGFADPDRVASILRAAGFSEPELEPLEELMWLGQDAGDVVSFLRSTGFGRAVLDSEGEQVAEEAFRRVAEALEPYESPDGVRLRGSAWLVTAQA